MTDDLPYTELRRRAEEQWAVRTALVPVRKPGVRGLLTTPLRALLRPLIQWYVGPLVDAQREFNDVVVKLLDVTETRLGDVRDARLLAELEERVFRLESLRGNARPGSAQDAIRRPTGQAATATQGPPFDYFMFEARMRGSSDDVRLRQEAYARAFVGNGPVLDIGCGRGEFLSLLIEAGIPAVGIDANSDMVDYCRALELPVTLDDAVSYLRSLEQGSLGGIFCAQVVEHLTRDDLTAVFPLAASRLRTGGVMIVETMNPLSLHALKNYWADLTHTWPLVPETLSLLIRQAGFRNVEVRYAGMPSPDQRLETVPLPTHPRYDDARLALASNVQRLNEILFAPADYAVIAQK